MSKIPVPSWMVVAIEEEGDKVILVLKNNFKISCNKNQFDDYERYKSAITLRGRRP